MLGYKQVVSLLLFFFITHIAYSKSTIDLNLHEASLSEVFMQLHTQYGLQLSYDETVMSNYKLTIHKQFKTPTDAISYITQKLGLNFETVNGVFVIFKTLKSDEEQKKVYSGQLIDPTTNEPLPYSTIQLDYGIIVTDEKGQFFFETDSSFQTFSASHIGCFVLDTVLASRQNQTLYLHPSTFGMQEIIIRSNRPVYDIHLGESAGLIKLNHKLAKILPGNNNNTLYNLLRLQPGILANSEYGGGYNIWGSDRGDNQIVFDGITIFNTSSLDTEIGVVNPLIVKNIELYRTGYGSQFGDITGGVIEIIGKQGNLKKNEVEIHANNTLVNGSTNIALGHNTSLQAALRHSYNDLININTLIGKTADGAYSNQFDFKDVNLKLYSHFEQFGNLSIGLIKNWDNQKSHFYFKSDASEREVFETKTTKTQLGLVANYELTHSHLGHFKLSYAFSELDQKQQESISSNQHIQLNQVSNDSLVKNKIDESKIQLSHRVHLWNRLTTHYGVVYKQHRLYMKDSEETHKTLNNYAFFVQNKMILTPKWNINFGLRTNYIYDDDQYYLQPRLKSTYSFSDQLKLNVSWSQLHQFTTESSFENQSGNLSYYWTIMGTEDNPPIRSEHTSIGLMWRIEHLTINIDGYYKSVNGKVYYELNNTDTYTPKTPNRLLYGTNLFIKYKYNKHTFWLNYALSKHQHKLNNTYTNLPSHQLHELKAVALLNLYPFFISSNYVYGSGLHFTKRIQGHLKPYSRFDLAFLYQHQYDFGTLDLGVSLVNLFNHKNISVAGLRYYSQFSEATLDSGIPFTPSLFVSFKF